MKYSPHISLRMILKWSWNNAHPYECRQKISAKYIIKILTGKTMIEFPDVQNMQTPMRFWYLCQNSTNSNLIA